jgi:hypothetical protein
LAVKLSGGLEGWATLFLTQIPVLLHCRPLAFASFWRRRKMERLGYSVGDLKKAGICGTTKAYELIAEGKLKTIKLGRKTIILADSVRELMSAAA